MSRLSLMTAALVVSLGAPLLGQPAAVRQNSWTQPHVLRFSTGEDLVGLNPHLVQQNTVWMLAQLSMAYLLRTGVDNRPRPELATAVPTKTNGGISADGRTLTWHLRHDAQWSDGAPFNADDVLFTVSAILNPKNNEISRDGWDLISKIEEPDKYTVVVHLTKPYAAFVQGFFSTAGLCLLPKHLLQDLPDINAAAYNSLPIGIGPFKFESWKRGDSVTLVANDRYFRGRPKLDKIVYKMIPDRNALFVAMQTGQIDMWPQAPAAYFDRLKSLNGFAVLREAGSFVNHIDFNITRPAVHDVAVRRALRLATDRQTLLEKVGRGLGILQESSISSANPAYDRKIARVPFDIVEANRILDTAGWVRGADGIRSKDGVRLTLTLVSSAGTPDTDTQLELIRSWWSQLGVEIERKVYPAPLLFAPLSQGGIVYSGNFDAVFIAWRDHPSGDLSGLYECKRVPPNGQNVTRYCNPEMDEAMEALKVTLDEKARQLLTNRVQEQIVRDAPSIIMWVGETLFVFNRDLENFRPGVIGVFDDMLNVDI